MGELLRFSQEAESVYERLVNGRQGLEGQEDMGMGWSSERVVEADTRHQCLPGDQEMYSPAWEPGLKVAGWRGGLVVTSHRQGQAWGRLLDTSIPIISTGSSPSLTARSYEPWSWKRQFEGEMERREEELASKPRKSCLKTQNSVWEVSLKNPVIPKQKRVKIVCPGDQQTAV